MARFKDTNEREWTIKLTVGLIEDIKEQTGFDLNDIVNSPEKMADLVLANPKKLVEVFYVCCESQVKAMNSDAKSFGRMFDRETLDAAGNALLESICDFFPRSSAGRAIREQLPRMIEDMDRKIYQATRKNINSTLLRSATDSPESSV